ncbi:hypothetical protein GCM10022206_48490 [Streptomyces chiangmaiensis]
MLTRYRLARPAYSEIHTDERKETATAFWTRAQAFFTSAGISIERVLTDNGSCYRSRLWRDALTPAGITHKRTRPYRPQTNGKVERLNRTLLDERAYARPYRSYCVAPLGSCGCPMLTVRDCKSNLDVFVMIAHRQQAQDRTGLRRSEVGQTQPRQLTMPSRR